MKSRHKLTNNKQTNGKIMNYRIRKQQRTSVVDPVGSRNRIRGDRSPSLMILTAM
uniref:Uncharacterized protein n=1 Tax=Helianthus annuus TaxID=4232 RepID=A0A9K3GUE1_HELAN|nr:hypothetical protein HanXRQr2_Chr17g0799651 [Helianthus annuus]